MEESDWRQLAERALAELDGMALDDETRRHVRDDLSAALTLPVGAAKARIREVLTSVALLRAWLRARVPEGELKAAGGDTGGTAGARPPYGHGDPVFATTPDVDSEMFDDLLSGDEGTTPVSAEDGAVEAGDDSAESDIVFRGPPLVLGDDEAGTAGGDSPPAARPGRRPAPDDTRAEAEIPDEASGDRKWLVTVEGYDESVGLAVAEPRTVHLGVGFADATVTVSAALDEVLLKTIDMHAEVHVFELVVQATSGDFDIAGEQEQTLRVPREGGSLGSVTWELTPRHSGDCTLVAAVSYVGNFLTQLELTLPVGVGGKAELSLRGRAPDSVAELKRKNLGLVIRPAASGYDLLISGDVRGITQIPITAASLSYAVDDVRKALLEVVGMTDDNGVPVFQTNISIPEEFATKALGVLAKAGTLLFNQLFFPDTAPEDLKALGRWLRTNATKPGQQLEIEVMAQAVSIPWAMLYCGDTRDGADLSWDHFLGLSHRLNAFPLPPNVEERDVDIDSQPQLSVGLNISTTIDAQFGVTWIAEHQKWWAGNAAKRQHLVLSPRSTKASVVAALDDTAVADGIVYFLCHASSPGLGGNPLDASMNLGQGGPIVLKDLKSISPPQPFANRPLVFINACESGELDPRFYEGFVTYFVGKGARGVIGTECKVPVVVAIEFADRFFQRLLDGETVGDTTLGVRRELLAQHHNPLGLVYGVHCDADTRILPALLGAVD